MALFYGATLCSETATDTVEVKDQEPKKKKNRLIVIGNEGLKIEECDDDKNGFKVPGNAIGWLHGFSYRRRLPANFWIGAAFYGTTSLAGKSLDEKEPFEISCLFYKQGCDDKRFQTSPFIEFSDIHYNKPGVSGLKDHGILACGFLPQLYIGAFEIECKLGFEFIGVDFLEDDYVVMIENDFTARFGAFYYF
jgi:hypothetical protein